MRHWGPGGPTYPIDYERYAARSAVVRPFWCKLFGHLLRLGARQ